MFAAEFHYLLSTLLSTIKDDCVWVLKFENIITQTHFFLRTKQQLHIQCELQKRVHS